MSQSGARGVPAAGTGCTGEDGPGDRSGFTATTRGIPHVRARSVHDVFADQGQVTRDVG